jgi:hypothetical protein
MARLGDTNGEGFCVHSLVQCPHHTANHKSGMVQDPARFA